MLEQTFFTEGGAAIGEDTSQVPKKYLNSSIKQALKDIGLSNLKYSVVGNISSEFLGDIDIAVDIEELINKWNLPKEHYSKQFWEAIKTKIKDLKGAKINSGLKIFHIPVNLVDESGNRLPAYKNGKEIPDTEGTAQIDVFVGNLNWMKDIISGKPADSNFKAVFRNIFLLTIVSTVERYKTPPNEKGEFEEHKYALQISSGVDKVITKYISSATAKNPKVISTDRKQVISNQNELASWLFGKGKTWKDIDSFEKIADNFENNPYFNKKYGLYKEEIIKKLKEGYTPEQLEQIKNGGFGNIFNLEETISEGLLLETGAGGHLNHLYDNSDLTFAKIKEIFTAAASGELEGAEKTDGQNVMVSFSVSDGRVKGARTKGEIKSGGLTSEQMAERFSGHANKNLKLTFSDSLKTLEKAIHMLSPEDQKAIFGENTNTFFSVEIMDPRTRNTINYDVKTLVIHKTGAINYNRDNDKIESIPFPKEAEKLTTALKDAQDQVEEVRYGIQSDAIKKLKALTDKRPLYTAINRVNSLISNVNQLIKNEDLNLNDDSTIGDFMSRRVYILITSILQKGKVKIDPAVKMSIAKKILGVKGIAPSDISSKISKEELAFVKENLLNDTSKKEILKTAILPLELIVHDFAIKMLSGLESIFLIDNDKEVKRLRNELHSTIKKIESSGNEEHMKVLKQQMSKIKKLENITSAVEGFVFDYEGMTYKFTGNFAPMNRILGLLKYGDKKTTKQLSEAKLKGERIGLFPGAFKPPHKAHLKLVKEAAKITDKVIIYISPLGRQLTKTDKRNITLEMSQKLWKIYLEAENLTDKVEVRVGNVNSPVITTFDFISNKNDNPEYAQAGQTIVLFSGDEGGDEKRFETDFSKHAKAGVSIETHALRSPPERASNMREAISNNDKKTLMEFLPDKVNKSKVAQEILSWFTPQNKLAENIIYDIINENVLKVKYSLLKNKIKKEMSSVGGGNLQVASRLPLKNKSE